MGIWRVDREGGVIGVCMHLADRQWGGCVVLVFNVEWWDWVDMGGSTMGPMSTMSR